MKLCLSGSTQFAMLSLFLSALLSLVKHTCLNFGVIHEVYRATENLGNLRYMSITCTRDFTLSGRQQS